MTTCSMSVNLEQTDGPGKVPPPLHPGSIMAASSAAAVAAPIFNNSRRVTFVEGTGSFILILSLRWIREADPPPGNSPCQAGPVIESSPLQERRGLQNSFVKLDNPPAWLPSMSKAFRMCASCRIGFAAGGSIGAPHFRSPTRKHDLRTLY